MTIRLDGPGVTIADVVAVARHDEQVVLTDSAIERLTAARSIVETLAEGEPTYGVSTGFGALATVTIPPERRAALQVALVRSHAAGMGPAVGAALRRSGVSTTSIRDCSGAGSGVGALGAMGLALSKGSLNKENLTAAVQSTTEITAMVFMILLGSSIFSLVFRGFGGDDLVASIFTQMPGGVFGSLLIVMIIIFLLGFILDFIPIVGPVLLAMGIDPLWLGIMIAINLQTSFLTPPFGFALFYLRGVAPDHVPTGAIYRGVIPFIIIQILVLCCLAAFPSLVTALPNAVYGL